MNKIIILSADEKEKFERWIIENVDDRIVPNDEGNGLALLYNLIHLLRGDNQQYNYDPQQDEEIESWNVR